MADLQVPLFYEHAVVVLDKMRARSTEDGVFDATDFSREYVSLYPEEREIKEANGSHPFDGYLHGMLWEYERKISQGRIVGPLIKRLDVKQYRFIDG